MKLRKAGNAILPTSTTKDRSDVADAYDKLFFVSMDMKGHNGKEVGSGKDNMHHWKQRVYARLHRKEDSTQLIVLRRRLKAAAVRLTGNDQGC